MISWIKTLFTSKQDYYWKGRSEGWLACENLFISRIKEKYPEKEDQMLLDLLA